MLIEPQGTIIANFCFSLPQTAKELILALQPGILLFLLRSRLEEALYVGMQFWDQIETFVSHHFERRIGFQNDRRLQFAWQLPLLFWNLEPYYFALKSAIVPVRAVFQKDVQLLPGRGRRAGINLDKHGKKGKMLIGFHVTRFVLW